MHFQKDAQIVFGRRRKLLLSHFKKTWFFGEKSTKCPLQTKNEKMRFSTVKCCSKSRGLLLKVEKWKSLSSAKRYQIVLLRTYLVVLRKQREFFGPNFDKKSSGSENEIEEGRKQERCLPHLECTLQVSWKRLLKPGAFNRTFRKKPLTLGEKYEKGLCTRKKTNADFFWRISLRIGKFLARNTRLTSCFVWEEMPQYLFAQVFCSFEINASFLNQTPRKTCSESEKIDTFLRKKPTRTTY